MNDDLMLEYAISHKGKKYSGAITLTKDEQNWETLERAVVFIGTAIKLGIRKNKIILSPYEDDEEILAHFKNES